MNTPFSWPVLGCGAGLRAEHYSHILSQKPKIAWFEAVSENFMDSGGRPLQILTQVREQYPIALHGVALSIGSADPLHQDYLKRLKILADRIDPFVVSDHLCWSGVDSENLHDLLPLPLTDEAADYVAERIQKVQDFLGRKILIENVSTYVTYCRSAMPEWEFLKEVARRAGCGILLDLNNIYVNSKNHHFDAQEYLKNIPSELVGQFHLAGHTDMGSFLFDTHSSAVVDPVWDLYRKALSLYGPVSTLIEWDASIPEFSGLEEEVRKAEKIYAAEIPAQISKKETIFSPKKFTKPFSQESWKSLLEDQRRIKTLVQPGHHAHTQNTDTSFLNPQGGVSGEERMSVYAGGYVARMLEALTETYEAVKHLAGEEAFARIAEGYADQFPSHDYNLTDAARNLPEFLKASSYAEKLPFLPDLARLERLIVQSFHAFEGPVFNPASLSGLAQEDWDFLKIDFQPSVMIFSSSWPVLDLWNARKKPLKEIQIDLVGRAQSVLVFRQGADVRCVEIDLAQFQALDHLMRGKTLEETCSFLSENASEEDLPLMEWFSFWVSNQLLSSAAVSSNIKNK